MEDLLGYLKVRVHRGKNLPAGDALNSDAYVVISIGEDQKHQTHVISGSSDPEWNEELTLSIKNHNDPIIVGVYDKDTFTDDDKVGDAQIDIKPYLESLKMGLEDLPTPTTVSRVQPADDNCLADESCIDWIDGKIVQDMSLRLRNASSGEVEIQIEWIEEPGCKGLGTINL